MTHSPPASSSLPGHKRGWVWRIIQAFLQFFFVLWFRYRSSGLEHIPPNCGALLLINHQSFLDPMVVGLPLKRPVSFLARDSLFRIPVIGWILRNSYVMPISRQSAGTESIRLGISRMKEGFLVGIFPEGTRSTDGEVADLKPGFIALARRAQVPIIPVGLAGAYKAMPRGSFFIRPTPISVYFGEPISVEMVQELTQKGQEANFVAEVKARLTECHLRAKEM